jgi:Raf kinase inhibitor-like YbhB/YbcL family protein
MSFRQFKFQRLRLAWLCWLVLVVASTALALHFRPSHALGSGNPMGPTTHPSSQPSAFALRSSAVADGGDLPVEFTGDGASVTPPLEWSHAPAGTQSFALIMHHLAPDGTKWYWILYNIPATVTQLPKKVQGVGTLGNNSINGKTEYAPPHSKGPGAKTYILTIYALSAAPEITTPPAEVNRDGLLGAMKDRILASAELHVVYTRFPDPKPKPPDGAPSPLPTTSRGPSTVPDLPRGSN